MTNEEFYNYLKNDGIVLNEKQKNQFEKYFEILVEYNKVINLTAITEKKEVYLKHFYDSYTLSKTINLLEENSLCDVGTGAGFPGVVLKILYPHLNVTLVDSLNKRVKFLNDLIEKLDLKNIEAIHSRAEDFSHKNIEKYDVVTARAVTNLSNLSEICSQLVKINKYFIPMKGNISQEIKNSEKAIKELGFSFINNYYFELPFEKSARNIPVYKKTKKTPKKFPRKFSEIKKNPL